MSVITVAPLGQPDTVDDPFTAVLGAGVYWLLAQAVKAIVKAFLAVMRQVRLLDGRERLVQHGPGQLVQTGIGPVEILREKLRD